MPQTTNQSNEQHPPETEILIVDDTPANLEILHKMLVQNRYRVRVASSGPQAISSAQASPPDLILLDIMMPDMDGYQVCGQLKAHHSTRNIPVIFLSALDQAFKKVGAFAAGGVDYITKPFQPEEVLARIKAHLALQSAKKQLEAQNNQLSRLNHELKQEIVMRIQIESELEKHRDHLEELAAARTATLQQEIAIRKQVQAEREHLLEQERDQRLHAEALRRITTALSSTLNYEKVLDLILEQIRLIVRHDTANIMLIEGDTARILRRYSYQHGKLQDDAGAKAFTLAHFPPLQTIYTSGQPLIISNITTDSAWAFTPQTEWIKSYLGVPIRVRRQVIGFLNVNSAQPDFFKVTDAERLQSLAYQAGIAIENARLFKSVSEQGQQLRALANRLTEVEQAERRDLARELHDQVGQNLTAISLNLKIVQNQIIAQKETLTGKIASPMIDRLADSLNLIEETTARSRNIMEHLRPPALDEYGLLAALKWYAAGFHHRTNITVTLYGAEPKPRLPAAIETVFFRIAQEALTNVTRHARAGHVEITLDPLDDSVRLTIVDDGVGFNAATPNRPHADGRQHWGLLNMMERAYAVGGLCRIESKPGKGTRVMVEIKTAK